MGKYMTKEDWKHSKYFQEWEFRCPCGKCSGLPKNGIYKSLVDNMNLLRQIYGQSITITSGYRCPDYNKKVGGVSNSVHILAGACDWNFTNKTFTQAQKNEIIAFIKKLPNYNYSYSNQDNMYNAIHIDTKLVECASWGTDITEYETNIKELETQIEELHQKILELKATINELEKLNVEANEKVVELTKQLKQSEKEKQEVIKQLEETTNEYNVLFHIGNLYVCLKN